MNKQEFISKLLDIKYVQTSTRNFKILTNYILNIILLMLTYKGEIIWLINMERDFLKIHSK